MPQSTENYFDLPPIGRLGIISLKGCDEFTRKVDDYLVQWRADREHEHRHNVTFEGYERDSYIIKTDTPRFGSGEGKGVVYESVRGNDLYFIIDVTNYNVTYKMRGEISHMSPDDHYQDLKRMIAAVAGKGRRLTVIMPFLYESRQHKRTGRESLDCAQMLQELVSLGVENIITFDAHDPRVHNAIPLSGFENPRPTYQFVKAILRNTPDMKLDPEHLMIISPDEGAMERAIYLANNLGVDVGMFYKRRDYSTIVNGKNPIVAHEFLGANVAGKDMIIVDDMISSGDSILDVATQLKKMNANRIFMCCTFGLFTDGLEKFDKAYEEGLFTRVVTTNSIYQPPELLEKPYYINCDLTKYVALIIDTLNHDASISGLLDHSERIQKVIAKYNNGEVINP